MISTNQPGLYNEASFWADANCPYYWDSDANEMVDVEPPSSPLWILSDNGPLGGALVGPLKHCYFSYETTGPRYVSGLVVCLLVSPTIRTSIRSHALPSQVMTLSFSTTAQRCSAVACRRSTL